MPIAALSLAFQGYVFIELIAPKDTYSWCGFGAGRLGVLKRIVGRILVAEPLAHVS